MSTSALKRKLGTMKLMSCLLVNLPRFVRVNTHKTDIATVIKHFAAEGYKYLDEQELLDGTPYSALQPKHFCSDYHIPELLVFAHGTDLHAHPLYESGDIILQACFDVYLIERVLSPFLSDKPNPYRIKLHVFRPEHSILHTTLQS